MKNNLEPESLSGFGFWLNQDNEILDDSIVVEYMAETLKQSKGDIDWDYGLMKRLPIFAEKNSEKTLGIITNYLLDSDDKLNQKRRAPLLYEDGIKEALRIIFKKDDEVIKQKVTDLINTLIKEGSSIFWGLKEVIEV